MHQGVKIGSIVRLAGMLAGLAAAGAQAQSLLGSTSVMERQQGTAIEYGYSFLQTPREVLQFLHSGYLVEVSNSPTLEIHDVSYPYTRPETKLLLDRLSVQYRTACGDKLIVTSLIRPVSEQPANASALSVHPTGMAVDLRIPDKGKCRSWLENTLLSLEKAEVLDVTRERRPPHYHVALFTKAYENYVANLKSDRHEYIVRRGDSLYLIADRNNISLASLRAANNLRGDLIRVGQTLLIPTQSGGNSKNQEQQVAALSEVTHKVRRGDTLWDIASRYGTTVNSIRALNNLSGNLLQIGQELKISLSSR